MLENFACPEGKWKCLRDHICILNVKFCDGNTDCADESDEMFCEEMLCLGGQDKCADQKTCVYASTNSAVLFSIYCC